jgi:hypothetical protein
VPTTRHSSATGRGGHARRRDAAARLALEADRVELADVRREVGAGQVDLLDELLRAQADDELAGGLGVAQRVLAPTEVNCTTGGSTELIVKNECGARLSTPSADGSRPRRSGAAAPRCQQRVDGAAPSSAGS